jgi:hydrogenase expression/formation protein HypE
MIPSLPVGKLPPDILVKHLKQAPMFDERILLGPGLGLDCAVIDYGGRYLVFKTDPITFATDQIGWYAVQVNANDIVTCGAVPRWMLLSVLLPEGKTSSRVVDQVFTQAFNACRQYEISVIGGHTEITNGLDRVILVATMIGEVERENLVTPRGARPGDRVLLTKGVPIEATALVARECGGLLGDAFKLEEIDQAIHFLYEPGISVYKEARIALCSGGVTAMHDPTEGGLAAALWELAEASQASIIIDTRVIPVPGISRRICDFLDIDPLAAIASGALLLTVTEERAASVQSALENAGILCAQIGKVEPPPVSVFDISKGSRHIMPRPERDAIARLFEH